MKVGYDLRVVARFLMASSKPEVLCGSPIPHATCTKPQSPFTTHHLIPILIIPISEKDVGQILKKKPRKRELVYIALSQSLLLVGNPWIVTFSKAELPPNTHTHTPNTHTHKVGIGLLLLFLDASKAKQSNS